MQLKAKYTYKTQKNLDDFFLIVDTNWGQESIVERARSQDELFMRTEKLKNYLQTSGYYFRGMFYPKQDEIVRQVNGKPNRKKNIDNSEYF